MADIAIIQSQSRSRKFQINTDGLPLLTKNAIYTKQTPIKKLAPVPTGKWKWVKHGGQLSAFQLNEQGHTNLQETILQEH